MIRSAEGSRSEITDLASKGIIWAVSPSFLASKANDGIESRVEKIRCEDTWDANYFNPYASTGNISVSKCSDAKDYCAGDVPILRAYCPVTCGCDDPLSGLPQHQPW